MVYGDATDRQRRARRTRPVTYEYDVHNIRIYLYIVTLHTVSLIREFKYRINLHTCNSSRKRTCESVALGFYGESITLADGTKL